MTDFSPTALRRHAVTLTLDMGTRTATYHSAARPHETATLPVTRDGPLTAALGLFNNTATVTGVRCLPPDAVATDLT